MERLILINGKGEQYSLFDETKSPTFTIEGLGYSDKTEFLQIGDEYYPLEDKSEQGALEMTLSFWNGADEKYCAFVSHARHNPLTMLYETDAGVFYIPCRLRTISRLDQPRYKRFVAPVKLVFTGKPYQIISAFNSGEISAGKTYDYTYDYAYSEEVLNTVVLNVNSYVESPCILTIYGEATNPVWRHYVNNELVATGAYNGTISSGRYLVIDSQSMPYSIIEYDSAGNVVADRYQLCDFSTERFLHLGEGENRITLSHDGVNALKLKVEGYIKYEAI